MSIKIGLAIQINENDCLEEKLEEAVRAGFDTVQLALWDMGRITKEEALKTKELLKKYHLTPSEIWCGWHQPAVWDFKSGPSTLGIVPTEYRATRIANLIAGAEYAKILGVNGIVTHIGFLPSNPCDRDYVGVVEALKYLLTKLDENKMYFSVETGQEPPVSVLRLIHDVGMDNFGVNFDPANLMMYGNANAMDALVMLHEKVFSVHAKDGEYPVNGWELGEEKPLGKGSVNFKALVQKLREYGFDGVISIENERDNTKEARFDEIVAAKAFLESLL
ncbi:MAG: sugar phosphate isomerase/epimerase family protein [Christensenella sp.]